jgi:serine protease DegQ
MRRLWLLFAQTVTVCLGILFIVQTLRPDLLGGGTPHPSGAVSQAPVVEPAAPGTPGPESYSPAVARAVPAVVNVYTRKHVNVPLVPLPNDPNLRQFFGQIPGLTRPEESTSLGSGVIVRADGHILTNYHVIEAAEEIDVALSDGRQARAKVVGADPDSDLAVLKINLPRLQPITFRGDQPVRVGDVVLAIGNPFGVGQTTTLGIVSALGRTGLGINLYENFIQTDAAINPGNSGGALIDSQGRLVGINTAIYSETGGSLGIGFAIPATTAHAILDQIVATGKVSRGWLGVEPQDLTPDLARAFGLSRDYGVIIAGVLVNGPAARGGVRVGDIMVSLNGQPVRDAVGFLNQIAPLKPGEPATLVVLRNGKEHTLKIDPGLRPAQNSHRRR